MILRKLAPGGAGVRALGRRLRWNAIKAAKDVLAFLLELAALGFHHRLVRSRAVRGTVGVTFLARWASRKGGAARLKPHPVHDHAARLAAPVEQVVQEINLFLRGWAGYFRYGNSARALDKIRGYALLRVALFIAKRHQRGRAWGFARVYGSGNELGLISINGIVIAPRPNRPGGLRPNAAGKGRR